MRVPRLISSNIVTCIMLEVTANGTVKKTVKVIPTFLSFHLFRKPVCHVLSTGIQ